MHLSLLSDCYLSDSLDEISGGARRATGAVAHRDGLLRGLAMMGVAGVLLGLTAMSTTFHSAEADTASCGPLAQHRPAEAKEAAPLQAAVWWESNDPIYRSAGMRPSTSMSDTGTGVSLATLRQRFRSACR